jgi:para-nitrobenzyl esterase
MSTKPGQLQAIARGRFHRVPIVNGTNHAEARLFAALDVVSGVPVSAANYETRISLLLGVSPAVAARVAAEYPLAAYSSPILAFSAVDTDAVDACPALKLDS